MLGKSVRGGGDVEHSVERVRLGILEEVEQYEYLGTYLQGWVGVSTFQCGSLQPHAQHHQPYSQPQPAHLLSDDQMSTEQPTGENLFDELDAYDWDGDAEFQVCLAPSNAIYHRLLTSQGWPFCHPRHKPDPVSSQRLDHPRSMFLLLSQNKAKGRL